MPSGKAPRFFNYGAAIIPLLRLLGGIISELFHSTSDLILVFR